MDKKTERGLYRNTVSYFGGLIILISLVLIILFLLLSFAIKAPSPYIGILTYLVFPAILTWGIFIFAYGLLRESRRRRRLGAAEALPFPTLDLNNPYHRKRFALILIGGSLLGILFAFVNYNAYLFTDSNTFCGKLCHTVMKPEYTAYLNGPHARVPCVDCHVGAGVSWYVKAKISGVPQVFATLFHTYSRPISVPIKSLRPARETCDECHWPEKFYGAQLIQNPFFRYNERNTPEQISLLVKTGGGTPNLGENAGIHWHMIISEKVYFKATDPAHQHIPWVKVVSADGSMMVYKDRRAKLTEEEIEKLPANLMDCMDCHNRPSHIFLPPEMAVDKAMAGGLISSRLPWIKKLALDALVENYKDANSVQDEIRLFIEGYYTRYYPDVLKRQRAEVTQAVNTIFSIHSRNVFPTMRVNWTTYPNDIGHRNWPGCFRCHDNQHVNQSGKVLSSECSVCHTMPQRGPLLPLGATASTSTEPWHPWPLKGAHERILCSLCHRAGYRPPLDCISCHRIDTTAPMMKMACKTCHLKEAEAEPLTNCRSCHKNLFGLHKIDPHASLPCTSCHTPHRWKVTARASCLTCHEDKKDHEAPALCGECHPFRIRRGSKKEENK